MDQQLTKSKILNFLTTSTKDDETIKKIKQIFYSQPISKMIGEESFKPLIIKFVEAGFSRETFEDLLDLAMFESYVESVKEFDTSNFIQAQLLPLMSDLLSVNIHMIDDRREVEEVFHITEFKHELNIVLYSKDYFMSIQPLVKGGEINTLDPLFTNDEVKQLVERTRYKVLYADETTKEQDFSIEVKNYENGEPIILIDKYSTDEVIDDPKVLSRYFPNWMKGIGKVDFTKAQMSKRSTYSTATRDDGQYTSRLLINILDLLQLKSGRKYSILDACSNVGGNALWFAQDFQSVTSVEIDKHDYSRLKNNIDLYGLKNVKIINDSVINVLKDEMRYNAIFFDPPWGGPLYKYIDQLVLALDYKDTVEIIDDLLSKDRADIIVMKHPQNVYINSKYFNYTTDFYKNFEIRGKAIRNYYYSLTIWINPKYIKPLPKAAIRYSHRDDVKVSDISMKKEISVIDKINELILEEVDFPLAKKKSGEK